MHQLIFINQYWSIFNVQAHNVFQIDSLKIGGGVEGKNMRSQNFEKIANIHVKYQIK